MPKILFVDDDPDVLVAISAQLRTEAPGCVLVTASSGEEGLEQARSAHPDLILLDVHLPGMDGYQVLRKLKSDPATRRIPVLFITAVRTEPEDVVRGLEVGAEAYLSRPIDGRVLGAQVRTLLRMKQAEDQLRDHEAELEQQVQARTKELSKALDQWKLTFSTTEDTIFLADADMRLRRCNPAFERLVGRPAEELIGQRCCHLVHGTEEPPSGCPFLRAQQSGHHEHQDWHINGRWYHTRVDLVKDTQGTIQGYAHVMRDITERKCAEQILACERRVLEQVVRGAGLTETLTELVRGHEALQEDTLGSLLLLDEAGRHLRHGAAPNLPSAYCEAVDGVEIGPSVGSCATAAFLGKPVVAENIETDPRWADFKELALTHGLRACWSVPIRGTQEKILGTFAMYAREPRRPTPFEIEALEGSAHVAALVIERERHLRTIRESEKRFREIIEHSTNLHYVHTPDHVLTYVSPQSRHFLGCEPEEANVLSTEFVTDHPVNRDGFKATERAIETGQPQPPYELQLLTKDGRKLWVEVHESPVVKNGRTVAIAGALLDITERKRLQAERRKLEAHLRQQEKLEAIGTLAGGVAHEINNPITGIMNYADIIRDQSPKDSELREFAGEIIRETERVATITRNLLTFARQEKPEIAPARVSDIVESTLSLIRTIVKRDRIRLESQVAPDLPLLHCQSQQIQQVLMNLMTNARDALNAKYPEYHDDKILRVTAESFQEDGAAWIRFTVEDHGAGIPSEVQARMFEPFFTTKPKGQGTGLGMSISRGIVEEHHGRIRLETEPGQFTRFHVELPTEPPASAEKAKGQAAE